jgi:uncharacterized protein YcaQ
LSIEEARRIALRVQGSGTPRPKRPGARHLAAVIRRLGLLQLDFVNVLVPSHRLVPFSRLGPCNRAALHLAVCGGRDFTEPPADPGCHPTEANGYFGRANNSSKEGPTRSNT